MAALLVPDYSVEIIDANALRMGWAAFECLLDEKRPKYYLTQVTAPTCATTCTASFWPRPVFVNDKSRHLITKERVTWMDRKTMAIGAATLAFGTHVTPMTLETMRHFPALDFVLRREPEMTLRELLYKLEQKQPPIRASPRC
jgi:hypothetical protein